MGYWGRDGFDQLNAAVSLVREEFGLEETPDWVVNFFPSEDAPGLVEFLFDSQDAPESIEVMEPEEPGSAADAEGTEQPQKTEDVQNGMQGETGTEQDDPPSNGYGWITGLAPQKNF